MLEVHDHEFTGTEVDAQGVDLSVTWGCRVSELIDFMLPPPSREQSVTAQATLSLHVWELLEQLDGRRREGILVGGVKPSAESLDSLLFVSPIGGPLTQSETEAMMDPEGTISFDDVEVASWTNMMIRIGHVNALRGDGFRHDPTRRGEVMGDDEADTRILMAVRCLRAAMNVARDAESYHSETAIRRAVQWMDPTVPRSMGSLMAACKRLLRASAMIQTVKVTPGYLQAVAGNSQGLGTSMVRALPTLYRENRPPQA